MITDLGYFATLLAFLAAAYAGVAALLAAHQGLPELRLSARRATYAACAALTLAEAVLAWALVTGDFGLEYAARYTSSDLGLLYKLAAVYAGNAGSLLFWAWVMTMMAAVAAYSGRRERTFAHYVTAVSMGVTAFFLLLVIFIASPFDRLPQPVVDGNGLNPMLENFGMLIHPPTLFLGYIGLTIPFAYALGALVSGRLDGEWLRLSRPWALFAWLMLGIGNILGMQWAYVELGWGGYWAWDPVENASLMPWLTATAYLHAAVVLRRRSMFKLWAVSLAGVSFLLAIFGTFLTRTGIVSSVHSFGETGLGPAFAAFLGLALLGTVALIAWRLPELKGDDEIEGFWSRENWVLIANFFFVAMTVVVLVGTMYPVFSSVFVGRKVELGKEFYNQANGPIMLAIVCAMGICPVLAWRRSANSTLKQALLLPAGAALALVLGLAVLGMRQPLALGAFAIAGFVLFSHAGEWLRAARARGRARGSNPFVSLGGLIWANRPRYGAHLVHMGIAVMAIGIVGSSFFVTQGEANLKRGESLTVGAYSVRFEGLSESTRPSRTTVTASVTVSQNGAEIVRLRPEHYFAKAGDEHGVTEVAIHTTPLEDVYVILAGWDQDGSATFKVLINPLVVWIWVGGALLLLGGVIGMWPQASTRRVEAAAEVWSAEPSAV